MSERKIGVLAPKNQQITIRPTETETLHDKTQSGVILVTRSLNSWAQDHGYDQSCNMFHLDYQNGNQLLVVTIPFKGQDKNYAALVFTKATSQEIGIISKKITESNSQEELKNTLCQLIGDGKEVEGMENAILNNLVFLPDSANDLLRDKGNSFDIVQNFRELNENRVKHRSLKTKPKETVNFPNNAQTELKNEPSIKEKPPERQTQKQPIKIKREQSKKIETVDEKELQEIDSRIKDRKLWGKFVGGVVIHGEEFAPPENNLNNHSDYVVLPFIDGHSQKDFEEKIDRRLDMLTFSYYDDCQNQESGHQMHHLPEGIEINNALIISYVSDKNDQDRIHVVFNIRSNHRDSASRPIYYVKAYFNCNRDDWQKLKSLGEINPDNWERFIQIAFDGIDQATNRRSVEEITMIDVNKFIPEYLVQNFSETEYTTSLCFYIMKQQKNKLDLTAVSRYRFSKPYPTKLNNQR